MTTTRIDERAGVSVGTLYQYFPNRQALIASVIERYLAEIARSIASDCRSLENRSLAEIATGLTDAFIAAKCQRIDVARAMHEPLGEVGGVKLVKAAAVKGADFIAALLRSCSDTTFENADAVALFTVASCTSLLQTMIADHGNSIDVGDLRTHMRAMVFGYLKAMGQAAARHESEKHSAHVSGAVIERGAPTR
jgi:AcrR family transcriptional regulator